MLAPLCGRPVVAHSIAAFAASPEVGEIIVVVAAERLADFETLVAAAGFGKVARLVPGGAERHLSVWAGLNAVAGGAEYIAIHDGARPLVTAGAIAGCLALARKTGAACCATPIPDTVKRASAEGVVVESVERAGLWAMQTPQIFRASVIRQAYAVLMNNLETATDEVSAVQRSGRAIALYRMRDWNFKITVPWDLELAEQIMAIRGKLGSPGCAGG